MLEPVKNTQGTTTSRFEKEQLVYRCFTDESHCFDLTRLFLGKQ